MYGITSSTGKMVLFHALAIALASAALCGAGRQLVPSYGTITGDRWIHLVSAGETWTSIGARVGVAPAFSVGRRNIPRPSNIDLHKRQNQQLFVASSMA
jgi:hypothetical protein